MVMIFGLQGQTRQDRQTCEWHPAVADDQVLWGITYLMGDADCAPDDCSKTL